MKRQIYSVFTAFALIGFLSLTFLPLIISSEEGAVQTDPITAHLGTFTVSLQLLDIAGLVFLILIVGGSLGDFISGTSQRLKENALNYLIAVGNVILDRTIFGVVFVVALFSVEELVSFHLPVNWWSWILALVLADFSYYWMHRWEHQVRFLWAYHSVHHSSPEFNLTTALRLAWVEGLIEWIFFIPMILIGFDAGQTLLALAVVVSYQTWIHTEKIGSLGWLDKVFNTPSVHRVHHGSNRQYLDKNYGGILIIWDRLFGTYQPEEEKVIYGVTNPVDSFNPITINFHEYRQIFRDVIRSRKIKNAFGYIFNRPGWRPD